MESTTSNSFDTYVVKRTENEVWRKCPYCGERIWDGAHSARAPGFAMHLSLKIPGHIEKEEWKRVYKDRN